MRGKYGDYVVKYCETERGNFILLVKISNLLFKIKSIIKLMKFLRLYKIT